MDLRVKVDEAGKVAPETDAAKRALGAQAGVYELMRTHPDLLAFLKTPLGAAKLAGPHIVMTGDAAGFPISDFVAFLAQSRWSGALRVHTPSAVRSVTLQEGEVRGATTDDPAERLSEVIIRLGFIERKKMEAVAPDATPPRLGRLLVDKGLLQPHDLWKCLTQQVSDIFHAIVLCREGTFCLVVNQEIEEQGQNLQLSTHNLLMDAIRKIDEMAHFRKRIPNTRMYVMRKRASDGRLEAEEDAVLAFADGAKNIIELGRSAQLSEFDATKIVFRLLEGGYVQLADRPVASNASDTADSAARTIVGVFNAIYREISDELKRHGRAEGFVATANAALQGKSLSSSPLLQGLLFEPSGVLEENSVLARYREVLPELGSEPLLTLRGVLSDVMFFLLFHAGEVLETQADEELARRVKELLSTLEGF